MPSFWIFHSKVERFIPKRACGSLGPPHDPAGLTKGAEDMLALSVGPARTTAVVGTGACMAAGCQVARGT